MKSLKIENSNQLYLIDLYIKHIMNDKRTGSIARLRKFHIDNLIAIKEKATNDGKLNLPDSDKVETLEKRRVKSYEGESLACLMQLIGYLSFLKSKGEDLKQKIENTEYFQLCEQEEHSTNQQVNLVDEDIGLLKREIRQIDENFATACQDHSRPTGKTDGNVFLQDNPLVYWLALILLVGLDSVYTMQAFEFYDLNRYASYSLGGMVAVGVGLCAHYGGRALKRKIKWAAITCLILLGIAGGAPSIMRYNHTKVQEGDMIETLDEDYMYDDGLGFQDGDSGYDEEMNSDTMTALSDPLFWTLAVVTFSLIFVSLYVSYTKYDSVDEFQECLKEVIKLKPKLEVKIREHKEAKSKLSEKGKRKIASIKLHYADDKLLGLVDEYESILSKNNQLVAHYNAVMAGAENYAEIALQEYRDVNISSRKDPEDYPAIWNQFPDVSFDRKQEMKNGILRFFNS